VASARLERWTSQVDPAASLPPQFKRSQTRTVPDTDMTDEIQPKHFLPGEGKTFKIGRMSMTFKTTAAAGWNAYTVCEAIAAKYGLEFLPG
jgi:hypothetical protein